MLELKFYTMVWALRLPLNNDVTTLEIKLAENNLFSCSSIQQSVFTAVCGSLTLTCI